MRWLFILVFVFLAGCAQTGAQKQEKLTKYKATIPQCNTDDACEIMWSESRRWVLNNASMKIQTYTNDFIETYNSVGGSPQLAARVSKEPQGNGVYRFVVDAWCANMFGCVPDSLDAMLDFNTVVTKAGSQSNKLVAKTSTHKDKNKKLSVGKYLYKAEQLAKDHGCEAPKLLTQNPPAEVFQTMCSGNHYVIKCEWGVCSVIK